MQEVTVPFDLLPTGKFHVSFSEVKLWKECSYRHKLVHIKKIDLSKPSSALVFGTAVHAAMEKFFLTREMNFQICFNVMEKEWAKYQELGINEFNLISLEKAKLEAANILQEVPDFFEKEFPNWEVVDVEHKLYENISGHPHAFKGFIDCIIKCKGKKGHDVYWLLDHKTTARGWFRDKRSDDMVKAQLGLYKNYWHQKNPQINFKDIKCGFTLLKKSGKPGTKCELFVVSIGEVPITRYLKIVNNMISSVKRDVTLKNRYACTWCEYKNTEHCT